MPGNLTDSMKFISDPVGSSSLCFIIIIFFFKIDSLGCFKIPLHLQSFWSLFRSQGFSLTESHRMLTQDSFQDSPQRPASWRRQAHAQIHLKLISLIRCHWITVDMNQSRERGSPSKDRVFFCFLLAGFHLSFLFRCRRCHLLQIQSERRK